MKIVETKSFKIAVNQYGNEHAAKMAILLPGRLDTKDYANFVSHGNYLAEKGFLVIAIDPPGTWDSPGDIKGYTTSMYVQCINELIDYFGNKPTLLLGHSRGGATAMLASDNPAVAGLVLVNAAYGNPSSPNPQKIKNNALLEYRDIPPGDSRTEEKRRFELPLNYFEDGARHNPVAILKKFNGPKLVIHATRDGFTRFEEVKKIYNTLQDPKTLLEIDCEHDYRLFPEAIKSVNKALGEFLTTIN